MAQSQEQATDILLVLPPMMSMGGCSRRLARWPWASAWRGHGQPISTFTLMRFGACREAV